MWGIFFADIGSVSAPRLKDRYIYQSSAPFSATDWRTVKFFSRPSQPVEWYWAFSNVFSGLLYLLDWWGVVSAVWPSQWPRFQSGMGSCQSYGLKCSEILADGSCDVPDRRVVTHFATVTPRLKGYWMSFPVVCSCQTQTEGKWDFSAVCSSQTRSLKGTELAFFSCLLQSDPAWTVVSFFCRLRHSFIRGLNSSIELSRLFAPARPRLKSSELLLAVLSCLLFSDPDWKVLREAGVSELQCRFFSAFGADFEG